MKQIIPISFAFLVVTVLGAFFFFTQKDTPLATMPLLDFPKQTSKYAAPPFSHAAAWEWRSPLSRTLSLKEVESLKKIGVTKVFLDLGGWIDDAELKNVQQKNARKALWYETLSTQLALYAEHNIEVEALFGAPGWSQDSQRYLNHLAISLVEEYNATASTPLVGIQFDVEPHGLENYEQDTGAAWSEYVTTLRDIRTAQQKKNSSLPLSFAVPAWLDDPLAISQPSNETYLEKVVTEVSQFPQGSLVFMAYRNRTEGDGGTLSLLTAERPLLQEIAVPFMIGQELNNEEPATITYFGKDWKTFITEQESLQKAFANDPGFSGIALHEVRSLLEKYQTTQF